MKERIELSAGNIFIRRPASDTMGWEYGMSWRVVFVFPTHSFFSSSSSFSSSWLFLSFPCFFYFIFPFCKNAQPNRLVLSKRLDALRCVIHQAVKRSTDTESPSKRCSRAIISAIGYKYNKLFGIASVMPVSFKCCSSAHFPLIQTVDELFMMHISPPTLKYVQPTYIPPTPLYTENTQPTFNYLCSIV